jgi:hypothetical protein
MIQFGSTQRLDIIAKALHEDEQSEWVCALASHGGAPAARRRKAALRVARLPDEAIRG